MYENAKQQPAAMASSTVHGWQIPGTGRRWRQVAAGIVVMVLSTACWAETTPAQSQTNERALSIRDARADRPMICNGSCRSDTSDEPHPSAGTGSVSAACELPQRTTRRNRAGTGGRLGPLVVCSRNRRYFQNQATGRAVYLTGSHTWSNLVDIGPTDPPPRFDFDAYLDWLVGLNHNFIRLWRWELLSWNARRTDPGIRVRIAAPHPWARTGPGLALDGKKKFDLTKFNEAYFERLRRRVAAARSRGVYVSVMLFEGWGMQFTPDGWKGHPFHPANNINGIDGDLNHDGKALEIFTLADPKITALQETYVRKVIDTVNQFDNVLYEISNENHPGSTQWQYHMIRLIKEYEKTKPQQHPVGMTFQYRGGSNKTLFDSPADWISPNPQGGYRDNPPPADGRKVILNDTDHLWGIGGNQAWVWKSFTRGHNPIFMDPYDGMVVEQRRPFDPKWDPIRRSLGYTRRYAQRMNLARTLPLGRLASTGFCLAEPGKTYLLYNPDTKQRTVELDLRPGLYQYEWFNPQKGEVSATGTFKAGAGRKSFTAPFEGESVLFISACNN